MCRGRAGPGPGRAGGRPGGEGEGNRRVGVKGTGLWGGSRSPPFPRPRPAVPPPPPGHRAPPPVVSAGRPSVRGASGVRVSLPLSLSLPARSPRHFPRGGSEGSVGRVRPPPLPSPRRALVFPAPAAPPGRGRLPLLALDPVPPGRASGPLAPPIPPPRLATCLSSRLFPPPERASFGPLLPVRPALSSRLPVPAPRARGALPACGPRPVVGPPRPPWREGGPRERVCGLGVLPGLGGLGMWRWEGGWSVVGTRGEGPLRPASWGVGLGCRRHALACGTRWRGRWPAGARCGPVSRARGGEDPRPWPGCGGRRRGAVAGGWGWWGGSVPSPPRPPRPLQVPSASRRGGLKTLGGVARPPWGRGGRARGDVGGPSLVPRTPPPPGRGAAPRR